MARYQDIYIGQGTDYNAQFNVFDQTGEALDLTNASLFGNICLSYYPEDPTTVIQIAISQPKETNGIVQVTIPNSQTQVPGNYVYNVDMENTITGLITRLMTGIVYIQPGVIS